MARLSVALILAAVALLLAVWAVLWMIAWSVTEAANPVAVAYVLLYAGGALCALLDVLLVLRVLPAWTRREPGVGVPTLLANVLLIIFLAFLSFVGGIALGSS
jgi:hypothetical protein